MKTFLSELWQARIVISQFVHQYVTLRYRRTVLGFAWTLLNPLFTMAVTSVVFSLMMRMALKDFAIFLFTGLIPWTLFSACALQGGGSIIENEALIKKIYIPRQVFVVSRCIGLLVDALLSFGALFIIAALIGAKITLALVFLPIAFVLVFVFSVGMALMLSVLIVYYRDTQHVIGIVFQAGYYLTPIIYPVSIVPERYRWIFTANPMYYFVDLFRIPIYSGDFPPLTLVGGAALLAVAAFLLGVSVFKKFDHTLIFRL